MADNEVAVYSSQTSNLVLEKDSMDSMVRVAEMMASAKVQMPDHFKGNTADCLAVVMQSMQWQMNPFMVAQKTFLTGGKLGYEAQLVNAVALSSGAFVDEPDFEFVGDWDKILGNVIEKTSSKGGKYYVPGWQPKDEAGLGVICTARMGKSGALKTKRLMMSQCYPRFSTQWATDPQQQISYAVIKKLVRQYAPGALLGVYTEEELQHEPVERDITPNQQQRPTTEEGLTVYPKAKFDEKIGQWRDLVVKGSKSPDDIIKAITSMYRLTSEQKEQISKLSNLNVVEQELETIEEFDDEFIEDLGDVEGEEL